MISSRKFEFFPKKSAFPKKEFPNAEGVLFEIITHFLNYFIMFRWSPKKVIPFLDNFSASIFCTTAALTALEPLSKIVPHA